jgi:prepilin-type N-terminal cleavage/methylation domain-containing protein
MVSQNAAIRRRGLTLMELLVVVAIIALLVALLLPVVNYARKRGYEATCLSNLRQLSAAWQLYTEDYKDYPPSLVDLLPYTKSREIYKCPGDFMEGANEVMTRIAGFPISYHIPPEDDPPHTLFRTRLREDPNHGIIVCVLHGERISNIPHLGWPVKWTGRVFRALHTGSVRIVHVPPRCYLPPTGGRIMMRDWEIFTDMPCPRDACPERYAMQEVPCF